jgi:Papain-like cysteine protease AvrRpt2
MGLLDESRIAIPLIPERLIAEAAQEQDLDLASIELAHDEGTTRVALGPAVRVVLADAFKRMVAMFPQWVRIPFTMQHQQQTNWCWSAASVSVARYYSSASSWTQCDMANQELGQTTCCVDGSSRQCNQPNVLDAPLRRAGVFDRMVAGSVAYATVCTEVDGGRPLPIRIGWSGGGGHFIAIEGYRSSGEQWVAIGDPWYGDSDVTVSNLTGGSYQGSGTWTHTYFTRRPFFIQLPPHEHFPFPRRIWDQVRAEHGALVRGGAR